ncbi:Putative WD40-repeat-containing domain superfamily [Septoria linicola]|uniref:WD40-repeat-containing domain superfamily n=1 Tax=Septoria linicola TaxID=215465 RepID=A0A9Q9EDR0_9PEZI|nr:putative WD40-repeat-containing domain superfamily [Septoria linicola]USW47070.1 Putative WD40-repeat-containing domain superfamily [Septoria linicola]
MPSAEDLVPDLDNIDEPPPATDVAPKPAAAQELEDAWGLSASPPKTSKKKKKGKKHAKAQQLVEDGEESSAYPKSITPSPPTDHGITSQPIPYQTLIGNLETESATHDDRSENITAFIDADAVPDAVPVAKPSLDEPPTAPSPRPVVTRPVSVSQPTQSSGGRHRASSQLSPKPAVTGAVIPPRRESFVKHASPRPRLVEPPPPHMPQAHFFGLPDLALGLGQRPEGGKVAGSEGYCCRLDSFADAGNETSAKKSRDALLVGSDGGLEVFRILPNKLEVVGRLEGLRGAVIGAKILPHVERHDAIQDLRPLVAVLIHGPMLDNRHDSGPEGDDFGPLGNDTTTRFQTTVDIYSLQTQQYLATLYASRPVTVGQPSIGQVPSLPRPVGDFELDAHGRFIILSSGKSGEVFVFTDAPNGVLSEPQFRCIGKFWTSIQRPLSVRPVAGHEGTLPAPELADEPHKAIFSASPRWLAIVPPSPSSSISIGGSPLTAEVNPFPPGISTHAPPPQPPITCEVVNTDTEGTWSRLGRQAAQGLVKVSQKGFEMGWQGWKELTQPSPPGIRSTPDHDLLQEAFPPTKAPLDDLRATKEPALLSLIDMDSLLTWEIQKPKYAPLPFATIALLEGCNFVSLSTGGTRLLTSSRKGEVSVVWDLTQVAHGISRRQEMENIEHSTCPSVKQLLRIARNSPSTVLSCAWSRDDDSVALLTSHGTIHLHEVPAQPMSRKRPRKPAVPVSAVEKADATVSLSTGLSPPSSGFLGSIKSWSQTVSTQVTSMRATAPTSAFALPTTFAGFREATAAAGNAGSRAVARGLSQGLTAAKVASSDYWHADDNKIRHTKALQTPFSAKSIKWIRRNTTTSLAVVCGGTVHVHPVQRVTRRKGQEIVSGLKHERYAHKAFPLPPISTKSDNLRILDSCAEQGPHGFWSLRTPSSPEMSRPRFSSTIPAPVLLSTNDVETNAPYCPFHVGFQIGIFAFEEMDHSQYKESTELVQFQTKGHGADEQPWTFGELLPPSTKVNDHMPDEFRESTYGIDEEEEDVGSQMESKLTIQPVRSGSKQEEQIRVNTRRRGKAKGGGGGGYNEPDLMEDGDGFL